MSERTAPNCLLNNQLLAALPGNEFARLLPHLEPVTLRRGQILRGTEKTAHLAYFPETAVLNHLMMLSDGGSIETILIGREGMVGLSALFGVRPPAHSTQALIGGAAFRIHLKALKREFASGKTLQSLLLAYAGARLAQLSQRAVCNNRHSVEERFCSWLLMARDRAAADELLLTHEQIGHCLGARRATITMIANTLREKGAIECGRGRISVRARQALEDAACECYRV
jgi:CRP-like cAMP-binding protein